MEGNLRYKVPQNIDMQDRILGPLTMLQFIYAVVGFGLCYSVYSIMPAPVSYVLITPIALFTTAMVFMKINERPFLDFIISVIEYSTVPRQRLWHHSDLPDLKVEIYATNNSKNIKYAPPKQFSKADLERFANQLDNQKRK